MKIENESQRVLIIGGGRGGSAFIELFANETLCHVVGLVDTDPNAPAFKLAEKLNIPVFCNVEDTINACKPCSVFNLTQDESVSELAAKMIGVSSVIGGLEAKLIWQMVTRLKDAGDELKKLAHYDAVTNLPNRVLFFERLKNGIAQAKRYDQKLAVLFLDLDGFKSVNDKLGHTAGDTLLKEVATRLLKVVREVDTVARFGGDEFAFVLNNVKNKENIALVANKILTSLSDPFIINSEICVISGSIGVSIFPDNHVDTDSLVNQADKAMYAVKNSGKNNYHIFEKSMSYK